MYRTDLITDPDTLAVVDGELASRAPRWTALSQGRLGREVDRTVAEADRDAVRRRRERVEDREVIIGDSGDGMASVYANIFAIDGHVLERRWTRWPPRSAMPTRGPEGSGVQTPWEPWPQERNGWAANVASPTARPAARLRLPSSCTSTIDGTSDKPGHLTGCDDLIPAELVAELAESAEVRPLYNPVDAPPEPGYVPSAKLAEFVRWRDLTCRAPGCDVPSSQCDIDHVVAFADGGLRHASNLSCKCRKQHLAKTFGGWRDQQLPDGTLIWTLPDGQTYVTTPRSARLFPSLCAPTGELDMPAPSVDDRCADRAAMMPKRRRTRGQNRAQRVAAEQRDNRQAREARQQVREGFYTELLSPSHGDGEPPPF